MAKVSVIMPVYNTRPFVGAAIASVRRQSFQDWEVIAIDDGSSDGSADLVASLAKNDSRIRLLRQANAGPAGARNTGCLAAKGRYLAFLDSDDLWTPGKLEAQLDEHRRTSTAITCTGYRWMDESGHILPVILRPPPVIGFRDILAGNPLGCLTVMVDTVRTGMPRFAAGSRHEDYRLWLSLLRRYGPARSVAGCLALYRIRGGSYSGRKLHAAADTLRIVHHEGQVPYSEAFPHFIAYGLKSIRNRVRARSRRP